MRRLIFTLGVVGGLTSLFASNDDDGRDDPISSFEETEQDIREECPTYDSAMASDDFGGKP